MNFNPFSTTIRSFTLKTKYQFIGMLFKYFNFFILAQHNDHTSADGKLSKYGTRTVVTAVRESNCHADLLNTSACLVQKNTHTPLNYPNRKPVGNRCIQPDCVNVNPKCCGKRSESLIRFARG